MTNITCAGGLFLSRKTKRFLLLLRTQGRTAGTWGLAGGKKEPSDKTDYDTLIREIQEELGCLPKIEKTIPIESYESNDQLFYYNTYVLIVEDEFLPSLNHEHAGYCWVEIDSWPRPLHQGVKTTLNSKTTRTKVETIIQMLD